MKIMVTQKDIDEGNKARGADYSVSTTCPVARALKREFPEADMVSVGPSIVLVLLPNKKRKFLYLNKRSEQWVKDFDFGREVQPFECELEEQ